MSLSGKRVFITGGSRGIGLEIAKRVARDGALVAIAAKTVEPQAKLAGTIFTAAQEIEKAGASAVHMEDQVAAKRCGHRPNKEIVSVNEMVDRIKAAVDARTDDQFVIMARTDALAVEGLESAMERAVACVEIGRAHV